jgi:hypothetical protein
MKKVVALVSCLAFVAVMSLGVNAQEPEKKAKKAKTEKKACCSKEVKKACGAKEAKECKGETKKEEKKK